MDGDPTDVCSIATLVALKSCKIPKVELLTGMGPTAASQCIQHNSKITLFHDCSGDFGALEDFDISGDLADGVPINCNDAPICISVAKVRSILTRSHNKLQRILRAMSLYIV